MAEFIGKSGSLMAAVLETAGYIYQAKVLSELESAFSGTVGGFIFLIGLVVALIAFTVHGSFKMAPWLLIGPPMFFAVILPRASISQAQWRFGQQPRPQDRVERRVSQMTQNANGADVQVSKLFGRYINLVSESVQEIVARINQTGGREDLLMIFRGDMLSFLYSTQVEESDFSAFLHDAFFYQCRNYIHAAYILNNEQFTRDEKGGANLILGGPGMENFRTRRDVRLSHNPRATRFVDIARGLAHPGPPGQGGGGGLGGGRYNLNALEEGQTGSRTNLTCSEVWDLTRRGLEDVARRRINRIVEQSQANNIPPQQMVNNISHAVFGGSVQASPDQGSTVNAESIDRLVRTASLYLLRNEYLDQGDAPRMAQNANENGALGVEVVDHYDFYQTERARVASIEWAEKTRLMSSAESLPYFQGLALYFLGFSFPFFALLLLIPGKHPGFILWFVLWLWVKSWDIGIAIVAMLDKLLFAVLGYQQEVRPRPHELPPEFGNAMLNLMTLDPTFQLGTYYNILAAALMSVPVISSQLIMGGLTGGAGLIASGMGQISQTIAGGAQVAQQQTAVSESRLQSYLARQNQAEAVNALMWNRGALTPEQRDMYSNGGGLLQGAALTQFRRDALDFGFNEAMNLANLPGARNRYTTPQAQGQARERLRQENTAARAQPGGLMALPPDRRPRGIQMGIHGRAFTNPAISQEVMRNYNSMFSDINQYRVIANVMDEMNNPTFNGGGNAPLRNAGAQVVWRFVENQWRALGVGSQYQAQIYRNTMAQMEVDQAVLSQNMHFMINYSPTNQRWAGTARIWGMLEVPWTMGPPAQADDAYYQQVRNAHVRRYVASLNALADLYDSAGTGNVTSITTLLRAAHNARPGSPTADENIFTNRVDEIMRQLEAHTGALQLDRQAVEALVRSPLILQLLRGLEPGGQLPPGQHGPVIPREELPSIAEILTTPLDRRP